VLALDIGCSEEPRGACRVPVVYPRGTRERKFRRVGLGRHAPAGARGSRGFARCRACLT